MITSACLPQVILSQGAIGQGRAFFQQACKEGLEGVIAKRFQSRYLPGKRTDAWLKIKRQMELHCAIIGFLPAGRDDFRSLILAMEEGGKLVCVGKVGTGFNAAMRKRLNALLWARLRDKPVVLNKHKGMWIELGLYCRVVCMERTAGGEMLAPAF